MALSTQEHNAVTARLTEIRGEREAIPERPSEEQARRLAELDRETTNLLRNLSGEGKGYLLERALIRQQRSSENGANKCPGQGTRG
jgi:hypothetical protein